MSYNKSAPYNGPTSFGYYVDEHNDPQYDQTIPVTVKDSSSQKYNTAVLGDAQPGWRAKIRRGQNATTSLTAWVYETNMMGVGISKTRLKSYNNLPSTRIGWEEYYPIFSGDYSFPTPTLVNSINITDAQNAAKMEFLRYLIRSQRSVQGGVFVGEIRETIRMIKNPWLGIRKLVARWAPLSRKIRSAAARRTRGLPPGKRKRLILKDLGDAWLENAFGWQPLLNDLDDACKALNKRANRAWDLERVYGKASREALDGITTGYSSGRGTYWDRETRKVMIADYKYYGMVKTSVPNPIKADARLFGFSAQDWLPTLWECTPWSFLIDYGTNISEIIDGWSWGRHGIAWSAYGSRKTYVFDYTRRPRPTVLYNLLSSSPTRHSQSCTLKSRGQYGGSFVPTLEFDIGLGPKKWINIASLIAGRQSDRRWRL